MSGALRLRVRENTQYKEFSGISRQHCLQGSIPAFFARKKVMTVILSLRNGQKGAFSQWASSERTGHVTDSM
jgi:hypothetical protein